MKKIIIALIMLTCTSPLFAASNPTVILQSAALGRPVTEPFTVNATFNEAVTLLAPSQVNITNGTVTRVIDDGCHTGFVMTIQPTASGAISIRIPANAVTSLSTGLANLASNTLIISGLDPTLNPSSNFDLRQWTLTLPIPLGQRNNAISIGQVTLNGIPSQNSGYSNPLYFFTDPVTGAMNFVVPLNGATTTNSDYARTELMEFLPGVSPTWKLSTFSSNTLMASLLVSHVPPIEKRFVIGQIHDKGNIDSYGHTVSNSPLLKLYYDGNALDPNKNPCNGCVYGQVRVTPSQSSFLKIVNLINNIPLDTLFIYQVTLLRDGTLTLKANNKSTTIRLNTSANNTLGWGAQNLYFKAGAYNLEHDSVEGGADSFFSLQVIHK